MNHEYLTFWVSAKEPHLWCGLFRNIWIREPITSPTGIKYEWNDEKKNYFNEKDEILPEEGFQHEGQGFLRVTVVIFYKL